MYLVQEVQNALYQVHAKFVSSEEFYSLKTSLIIVKIRLFLECNPRDYRGTTVTLFFFHSKDDFSQASLLRVINSLSVLHWAHS